MHDQLRVCARLRDVAGPAPPRDVVAEALGIVPEALSYACSPH